MKKKRMSLEEIVKIVNMPDFIENLNFDVRSAIRKAVKWHLRTHGIKYTQEDLEAILEEAPKMLE